MKWEAFHKMLKTACIISFIIGIGVGISLLKLIQYLMH